MNSWIHFHLNYPFKIHSKSLGVWGVLQWFLTTSSGGIFSDITDILLSPDELFVVPVLWTFFNTAPPPPRMRRPFVQMVSLWVNPHVAYPLRETHKLFLKSCTCVADAQAFGNVSLQMFFQIEILTMTRGWSWSSTLWNQLMQIMYFVARFSMWLV